jgi:hypothetical protein
MLGIYLQFSMVQEISVDNETAEQPSEKYCRRSSDFRRGRKQETIAMTES